jgi:asparagine synthase (glutamine-hydrolysing)
LTGTVRDPAFGLAGRFQQPSLAAQFTPEPDDVFIRFDGFPLLSIASDLSIYNSSDLARRCGLPARTSAERLVLALYDRYGESCPEFLVGEFAFAIRDERRQLLFCCRDHLGKRHFYYAWSDGLFRFSQHPLDLLRSGVPRRLNRRKLAGMAVRGGHLLRDEETFHEGIFSLPGGCTLTVSAAGLKKSFYWRPRIRPELVPRREDEAFEAIRELMFRCVRDTVAGARRPACLLSGGLDSSSVTAMAAKIRGSVGQPLLAMASVVPAERKDRFCDEQEYIDEFRDAGEIRIVYVNGGTAGPFDHLDNPARYEDTFIWSSRMYLYDAFAKAASEDGADLILEGSAGEHGPSSYAEGYVLELFLRRRYVTLIRELRSLGKVDGFSPARFLVGEVARWFSTRLPNRPLIYLNRAFARMCDVSPPFRTYSSDHRRTQLAGLEVALSHHYAPRMCYPTPALRYAWPLFDPRILEFCLAAPGSMKFHAGYRRYMVRRAMEGLLPPKIQWRTTKTPFSPDYPARYEAQLPIVRRFLAAIRRNDTVREIIDVDALLAKTGSDGVASDSWEAVAAVPATLYLICFLRQFSEFRA